MATSQPEPPTADAIWEMLVERYPENAWALFGEVRNATASRFERSADALAMSLWPSRGLHLHGFEIKVSRSDLARELREPAKSAPVQKYCDFWWLVLARADLLQPGELPPTWGVLAPRGRKLVQVVEAPRLEATPIDRPFLASLFRKGRERMVPLEIHAALKASIETKAHERAGEIAGTNAAAVHRDLTRKLRDLEAEHEQLTRRVKDFQERSGLDIDGWAAGTIGTAVRMLLDARVVERRAWTVDTLRRFHKDVGRLTEQIAELLKGLEVGFKEGR